MVKPPSRSAAKRGSPKPPPPAPAAESTLLDHLPGIGAARQLRSWAETALDLAGPVTDMTLALAKSRIKDPKKKAAFVKVGAQLRKMREAAGLSAAELAQAMNLADPSFIEQAEGGKIVLPFEMILRVAGVLGRSDPITFVMRLTRSYNPDLWKTLEDLGVGRLVVQVGREREFANIYRANDAARRLSDEDFADVLGFTQQAFDMAVKLHFEVRSKKAT